jgi:hypothetical protein
LVGCQTRNGPPKHGENVGLGILHADLGAGDLRRVAADEVVHRLPGVSLLTGGNTPNASQVRKMTFFGCPPTQGIFAFGMYSIG